MTDKSVRRGAVIERRFDNRVDKAYADARKKLLKDMDLLLIKMLSMAGLLQALAEKSLNLLKDMI